MEQPAVALHEVTVQRRGIRILGRSYHDNSRWFILWCHRPERRGKIHFAAVITGHQKPAQGSVTVLGKAQYNTGTLSLSKQIGILLQHHDFYPDIPFTVDDIVLFGRSPFHGPGIRYNAADNEARKRALEIMDLTGTATGSIANSREASSEKCISHASSLRIQTYCFSTNRHPASILNGRNA